MKLTPEEIISLKETLKSASSEREADYETIETAYGISIDEARRTSRFNDSKTRTKLDFEETDLDVDFSVKINLFHQIVESQRTVLGAQRTVRVPARSPSNEDVAYADKLEKALYYLWRRWNFRDQLSLMGWYCAVYGSAVGVLTLHQTEKIPMLTIRSPKNFYAVASMDDETELTAAMFVLETKGNIVKAEYGGEYEDDEDVNVIDFYSRNQRTRVIESSAEAVIDAPNPLKVVPIWIFPGIRIPGIFGDSTIKRAIPVHNEIERLYATEAKVMWINANGPTYINDPINVPENWKWGDSATITMGPQGRIGKASVEAIDANLLMHRIEDMKQNLDKVNDFSSVSRGDWAGSLMTGKGVTALQNPGAQRMEARLQSIDPRIEKVNSTALLMWNKSGKKPKSIAVKTKGSIDTITVDPKVDIDPSWVDNIVWLDSASFVDRQAWSITQLQKVRGNPRVMSTQRYLENDPDCDDVAGEMQRIQDEEMQAQARMMQMQMQAQQQMMQAQAPQQGGGVPPQEGGQMPPEGQPQGAEGTPEGAPAGTPGEAPPEQSQSLQALGEMLSSIPKIKGSIYIVGEALDGLEQAEMLELFLSQAIDKATISNFIGNEAPFLKGQFTFHVGTPNEPFVLVIENGQPTGDLTVQGEDMENGEMPLEAEMAAGEMPPEMMGMV